MYPYERSLVKRLEGKPFALIGVNSDPDREGLKPVLAEQRITWRSFWNGPAGPGGSISGKWKVDGWPSLFIIDAKGVIRYRDLHDTGQLDRAIDQLVAEAGSR